MIGSLLVWFVGILIVLVTFFGVELVYLSVVLHWENQRTRGLAYYGLQPDERARFKGALRTLGRLSSFSFGRVSFKHKGISGPQRNV